MTMFGSKVKSKCYIFITVCVLIHIRESISVNDEWPKVKTPLGMIQGGLMKSLEGKTIYSYKGIRFAKPPVGDLRFKAPEAVQKWSNVYNATQYGPSCPQPFLSENAMSEDCLMLNVFTRKCPHASNKNVKLPVVVYFFGGAFTLTKPQIKDTGPEYWLDEDVVLVIPNFRVGILGD